MSGPEQEDGRDAGAPRGQPGPPGGATREQPERAGGEAHLQDEFVHAALLREQGVHPRMSLARVHIRVGRRFISVWWLLPAFALFCVAMVVCFKLLLASGAIAQFIRAHPCEQKRPRFPPGINDWQLATHAANFFFMVMIVRAGWQILADHPRLYLRIGCTPDSEWLRFRGPVPKGRVWTAKDDAITLSPLFGLPGGRHTIGVARHWHFLFDILFVLNGIAFIVLTFLTQHYLKLVPTRFSILPAAATCIAQYAALNLPHELGGFYRFDALQQLSYFAVVFVAAPLAILTGIAMSPAFDNRFKFYQKLFGNRQMARSLHFLVMCVFLLFYLVHMVMVAATGFAQNLNSITLGVYQNNLNGVALVLLALAVTAAFNIWAVRFSWTHTRVLQRISNLTVGKLMDLLFDRYAPRAEYRKKDISPYFWPNGLVPTGEEWRRLREREFADYRLKVYGLVENPVELSLQEIRELGRESHITMHNCIQDGRRSASGPAFPSSS
jgi:sulfoxide reductase catalytic subunit YedY